jgi:hypothetical protein
VRLRILRWPFPYRFAFAITDDPDQSTVDRVRVIYDYCLSLGIRPTRCTWVFKPRRTCGLLHRSPPDDGVALDDPRYLELCRRLANSGIEFGVHGVSSGDNTREDVREGLDRFNRVFGRDPSVLCHHKHNAENIHWGESFFVSRIARRLVRPLLPSGTERYEGSLDGSPYFCGDLIRERVRYVRLFRTMGLDVLTKNPSMPFHLPSRPHVKYWFSAVAQDLIACRRVNRRSLDRLARGDGLLLLYAHMAEHLVDSMGGVHPEAQRAFEQLAERRDVWMASVTEVLDRCLATKNIRVVPTRSGFVVANPTQVQLSSVQIRCRVPDLFTSGGGRLQRVGEGLFLLPDLHPFAAMPLFTSERLAAVGDPAGVGRIELFRMMWEEVMRLISLRGLYSGIQQRCIPVDELREPSLPP